MEDNNLHRSLDWITQCHEPLYDKNEHYKHYKKKHYKKLHPLKSHYPIIKTWKTQLVYNYCRIPIIWILNITSLNAFKYYELINYTK
jgi:hypothetical protein